MKTTTFILGSASIATLVNGQAYRDTLNDYAYDDLSAILDAYGVGDYSNSGASDDDYNFEKNYDAVADTTFEGPNNEYEEVGPADIEFGDYPSGFDEQYFDGNSEDPDDEGSEESRLRPNKFEFDFSEAVESGAGVGSLGKLAQDGTGTHTGTSFNYCRSCKGETAAACAASNAQEECNAVQPVCEITVRIARKGAEPLYWSECKEKKSCYNDEEQNFRAGDKRFNQCKSTKMSARFSQSNVCTFCVKLGTATDQLLFRDTTGSDNALKILTTDGTTEINVADALEDPESYFDQAGGSYVYDSQTWYSDAMGSP